ncbi:MAG: aryl-sulfate sulfotransferase [Promethearchaeota archaeon]
MEVRQKRVLLSLVIIFPALSIILYGIVPNFMPFLSPCDVDYISNGQYEGCYLVSPIWSHVVIVDSNGVVKWRSSNKVFFLHDSDILPNGNILMADTIHNRVLEVDINDPSKVLWSWDALNISDINWTAFSLSQGWTDLSFLDYEYAPFSSWTHLNDVDFIDGSKFGRNYNSVLISLRNLNMILEVNYSKTKEVVWSYGQPNNTSILNQQHNPDRLDNGNTVICDTMNDRIIEINTTTKEKVWELKLEFPKGKFRVARDCDDIGNGLRLITDSGNNRLLIYDMKSQQFIKEIKSPWFANPYDADLLPDGNIVVSNIQTDTIVIIDYETGLKVKIIGYPVKWIIPHSLISVVIGYQFLKLVKGIRDSEKKKLKKILEFKVYKRVIYIIIGLLGIYFFNALFSFLWLFTIQG